MNKLQIEARLERSLRNQVRAPKLDGRFDAAVWARIESEKSAAASVGLPVKSSASRVTSSSANIHKKARNE